MTFTELKDDIDFWVNTSSTSYTTATKTANINRALDEAVALILESDGRWQFDDSNQTDLPIATTNLISGQQDYAFSSEFLDITRVEVQDQNGNWIFLLPFDQDDLNPTTYAPISQGIGGTIGMPNNYSLTDLLKTPGTPIYYDKLADSIFLYPAPSYNQDASLKVYFQRKPVYFDVADTTQEAGFAKHLHRFLSLKASLDYAISKDLKDKIATLPALVQDFRNKIVKFYSIRKKDEKVVLVARNTPSR